MWRVFELFRGIVGVAGCPRDVRVLPAAAPKRRSRYHSVGRPRRRPSPQAQVPPGAGQLHQRAGQGGPHGHGLRALPEQQAHAVRAALGVGFHPFVCPPTAPPFPFLPTPKCLLSPRPGLGLDSHFPMSRPLARRRRSPKARQSKQSSVAIPHQAAEGRPQRQQPHRDGRDRRGGRGRLPQHGQHPQIRGPVGV